MSDAVARARELLDKATPGPWDAATCHESEQETRSEYVRNALLKPDAPAYGLWMAWKPDSPHGEADAELIAAAPTLLAELADEVERLRALTTVDDAMVERAARAICPERSDPEGFCPYCERHHIADARAALEAALGVES